MLLLPNLKHMSTIARFRMSSHTLAIETGRHAKPKIAKEDRKCRHCNLDDVEGEEHFLLKCPLYNEKRLSLSVYMKNFLKHRTLCPMFLSLVSDIFPLCWTLSCFDI